MALLHPSFRAMIADRAFGTNAMFADLEVRGAKVALPTRVSHSASRWCSAPAGMISI